MAAQGRNNDSMLVHMTPKEVNGLHALAVANGGNLTINPETGLPEAGFLEDLLPAIIGFGLDTFVPGLGEAVGGMFGLSGAAGTGIAVGGLTGLATGSLSKGVMAGFGAYGGAGLAEGLMGAGANAATTAGTAGYESILADRGLIPGTPEYGAAASELALNAQKTALAASPMDRLTAGFSATTQNPGAMGVFAKDNWKNFVAAGAPLIAGGFSSEGQTLTPMPDNRMITPFVMNRKNLPYDDSISPSGQRSYLSHGVTAVTPVHAASGGAVHTFDDGGRVGQDAYGRQVGDPAFVAPPEGEIDAQVIVFGPDGQMYGSPGAARRAGVTNYTMDRPTDDYTQSLLNAAAPRTFKNTMTGESGKAFDYLMGYIPDQAGKPVVPQTRAPGTAPVEPTTPMPGTTTEPHREGSGISFEKQQEKNDPNAWGNLLDAQKASWFADNPDSFVTKLQQQIEKVWPFKDMPEYQKQVLITQGMDPTTGYKMATTQALPGSPLLQSYAKQYAQNETPETAEQKEISAATERVNANALNQANAVAAQQAAQQAAEQDRADAATRADAQKTAEALANQSDSVGFSSRGSDGGSNTSNGRYSGDNSGDNKGWGSRDAGGDARGGFLNNGKFDQRYAYGGGIAALSDGGLGSLGGYSDGGRLLRGPGDGVSDSIPATIGQRQPARLADGEFVVPARIVSELGNGSTEAGARQLYAMMDRIQAGRKKTVGKNKVAANTRAAKHLPA